VVQVFQRYSDYLKLTFSDDYWSDEGIGRAIGLFDQFVPDDWEAMLLAAKTRDPQWLTRCAQTLGDQAQKGSMAVLLALLEHHNQDVNEAALDSIHALASQGLDISAQRAALEQAIVKLRPTAGPVASKMLDSIASIAKL
jgi:hypothetical protein